MPTQDVDAYTTPEMSDSAEDVSDRSEAVELEEDSVEDDQECPGLWSPNPNTVSGECGEWPPRVPFPGSIPELKKRSTRLKCMGWV